MTQPNGYILFEGPSRIDRQPIVVIATGLRGKASSNAKTGAMVQTWILRSDVDPMSALRTGADVSICGGCRFRPKSFDGEKYHGRTCYVNVAQAPNSVYKAYKRGVYPALKLTDYARVFAGKLVRFGSYGDPAAVPLIYWQTIANVSRGTTGYTHQWKSERLRDTLAVCQLSADSEQDMEKAARLGIGELGSFRVKRPDLPVLPGEIVCPASAEAGKLTHCAECLMCSGGTAGRHIVINAHGIGAANL